MRKQSISMTLAGSVCLSMCLASAHAQRHFHHNTRRAILPSRLKLSIGGFLDASYDVEWKGHYLSYMVYGGRIQLKKHKITPSMQDWKRFWKDTDTVRLWKWRSQYNNPKAQDGTQWQVLVQQSGRQARYVHTRGNNCYPSDKAVTVPNHDTAPSQVFQKYLAAVRRLIGGKDFR